MHFLAKPLGLELMMAIFATIWGALTRIKLIQKKSELSDGSRQNFTDITLALDPGIPGIHCYPFQLYEVFLFS